MHAVIIIRTVSSAHARKKEITGVKGDNSPVVKLPPLVDGPRNVAGYRHIYFEITV